MAGGINAAANGGNIARGTLWGAFSGAAFYGVGSMFGETTFGSGAYFGKVAAHGLVGGVMSTLQGGKFGHGFAAAGTAQAFAPGINGIDKNNRFSAGRITMAAVAGGTASKLSGGKFANGAITGAFSRMFNDEMHYQQELKRFGATVSEDIRKRHRELQNWQKDEDWRAVRDRYPDLTNVPDSNMKTLTGMMMMDFHVLDTQFLAGNVGQTFYEGFKNGWDVGSTFIPAPTGFAKIFIRLGFSSAPSPIPYYHYRVTPSGYVSIRPGEGG